MWSSFPQFSRPFQHVYQSKTVPKAILAPDTTCSKVPQPHYPKTAQRTFLLAAGFVPVGPRHVRCYTLDCRTPRLLVAQQLPCSLCRRTTTGQSLQRRRHCRGRTTDELHQILEAAASLFIILVVAVRRAKTHSHIGYRRLVGSRGRNLQEWSASASRECGKVGVMESKDHFCVWTQFVMSGLTCTMLQQSAIQSTAWTSRLLDVCGNSRGIGVPNCQGHS